MISVQTLGKEALHGTRVFLRSDLNVPVEGSVVRDLFRITRAAATIEHLRAHGAKVIMCAHIGRKGNESLAPVAHELKRHVPVTFVPDVVGAEARAAASSMMPGDVLLLENVRTHPGEEANDQAFARALAAYADMYVGDAFSAAHRAHASIVGVPALLPHYAGLLLAEETARLTEALSPKAPSFAILGGAKFDTKEPLIKKLLATYDHVLIAGALANDVLKAQGHEVGRSLVSERAPDHSVLHNPKLLIPTDCVVERPDGQARVRFVHEVEKDEKIVDIGPDTFASIVPLIQSAQFVLWNGPTGLYEGGYDDWTHALAEAIAESDATSIVGGGDTVAAIGEKGLDAQFTFLSTAGGAMLEFLLDGTLPGVRALA